jgi:hypothetical protein
LLLTEWPPISAGTFAYFLSDFLHFMAVLIVEIVLLAMICLLIFGYRWVVAAWLPAADMYHVLWDNRTPVVSKSNLSSTSVKA